MAPLPWPFTVFARCRCDGSAFERAVTAAFRGSPISMTVHVSAAFVFAVTSSLRANPDWMPPPYQETARHGRNPPTPASPDGRTGSAAHTQTASQPGRAAACVAPRARGAAPQFLRLVDDGVAGSRRRSIDRVLDRPARCRAKFAFAQRGSRRSDRRSDSQRATGRKRSGASRRRACASGALIYFFLRTRALNSPFERGSQCERIIVPNA